MIRMIMMAKLFSGNHVGLKLPEICLTGEKKPKNLTKETCPDRGSNLDPLRNRRACYRLLHSGGQFYDFNTAYSRFLKIESIQNSKLICPLVFETLIFKLILICKFQNVPCELGFEVKHSKMFCKSFRK